MEELKVLLIKKYDCQHIVPTKSELVSPQIPNLNSSENKKLDCLDKSKS